MAAPLYDNLSISRPAEPLQPLAIALALVPFPLIALLKLAYLRFRRGQSIHALDSPLAPKATTSVSAPMATAASVSSSLAEKSNTVDLATDSSPELSFLARQRQFFWIALQPYLVGFLGSPDWEITISCRITNTLRREARHAAVLVDSTARRSTSATNPSTAYSTLSTKSHGTSRTSRSNHRSISLVDKTRHRLPNDFAFIPLFHPSSPPLIQVPPPAHLPTSSVRFSVQQNSPTLMQIMEPVLSSWYDDSVPKPPLVLVNDKSITTTDSSQDRSASAEDSSLPFYTPLASPCSPIPLSPLTPSIPFARLRQEHPISAASSMLTISAVSAYSPTSLSIAVFHSPIASSIPVPTPVYTPSVRPESCVVLPRDWINDKETLGNLALLQSPTHRSPALTAPTMFDYQSGLEAAFYFYPELDYKLGPAIKVHHGQPGSLVFCAHFDGQL
ncbi:hypothetical protein C8Q74DRAFT_1363803 [Fomes fomentarius]|nr:hypothetical protein C8Q74DRAFT_1363803 [Fomes fomentarius]